MSKKRKFLKGVAVLATALIAQTAGATLSENPEKAETIKPKITEASLPQSDVDFVLSPVNVDDTTQVAGHYSHRSHSSHSSHRSHYSHYSGR